MNPMISCAFNTDTACVELKYVDCSMIAVENEVADHMYQRSKPDWLIYNKPLEYRVDMEQVCAIMELP